MNEKNEKNKQKNMRSGRRPIPEGTRLVFAGGTASPMMCPSDEQKDDEKGQTDDKQAKMRAETKPKKTRIDCNEVVGFG